MLVRTDIRAIRRDNTMLIMKDGRMVMSSDNPRCRHGSGSATRAGVAMPAKDR